MTVRDLFDLSGTVAIVTGGGSGLGRQMGEALAEAGASVVLCGRRIERCEEAAEELRRRGWQALAVRCDVREPAEIEAVVARARQELGSVDVLVNNAGTAWIAPAEDFPLDGWRKVLDVNLTGAFLFAQAAGRVMIAQRSGKIVNVASIAAFSGMPPELVDAIAYNVSKGGLVSLTRDLAVKWARYGINVNAIAPGWFPTELNRPLLERAEQELVSRIPLGRLGGPTDLKGAVVFLASRASDFVTGHTLVIDGGQSVA